MSSNQSGLHSHRGRERLGVRKMSSLGEGGDEASVKTQSASLGSRPKPKLSTATARARAKWASARKEPSEELTRLALALAALSSEAEPQPLAKEPSLGVGVRQGRGGHSKTPPSDPTPPPVLSMPVNSEAVGVLIYP